MPTLLLFLILFVSGIVTVISSMGSIIEEGTHKFTTRGKVMVGFICVLVFLPLVQNWLQNKADERKERDTKIAQDRRDSTLKAQYDSSLSVIKSEFDTTSMNYVLVVSETLGKYGYKLDSSTKSLKKIIRDSSKTRIITESFDPVLSLGDDDRNKGISLVDRKNGSYNYEITIYSMDAGSSRFSLTCSAAIIGKDFSKPIYLSQFPTCDYKTTLSKGFGLTIYFRVNEKNVYDYLVIWLRGSYYNMDGSKKYFTDQVYFNNKNGNTSKMFGHASSIFLKDFITKNEK